LRVGNQPQMVAPESQQWLFPQTAGSHEPAVSSTPDLMKWAATL